MDKNQILTLIEEKIKEGVITPDEIETIVHTSEKPKQHGSFAKNITNIFYVIGALIALIGVIILIAQYWDEIGLLGRLLVTLGISFVVYVSALYVRGMEHRILAQVLFTISAVLMPMGVIVFFREMRIGLDSFYQTTAALSLGIIFLVAFLYSRRNILVLITLAFLTWGYYAGLVHIFDLRGEMAKWATMVLGVSYILIAYYYNMNKAVEDTQDRKEKTSVKNIIYTLGTIGILAPSLMFDDLFDLITLVLIFCAFYVSVWIQSKAVLLVSALFLMIYIFKITATYFSDSISWPIMLIIIGFLVIGVGYGAVYIGKTYIKGTQ